MTTKFYQHKPIITVLLSTLLGLGIVSCKQASDGLTATKPANTDTGTGTGTDPGTIAIAPSLSISQEKNELTSGGDSATFSIKTTDASGGIMSDVPLQLSITNPVVVGATFTTPSTLVTDDTGIASSGIKLSASTLEQQLDHPIVITVKAFDSERTKVLATQTLTFNVTGLLLNLTSTTTSAKLAESVTFNVALADALNKPISNTQVTLYDNNKQAAVTTATATTDSKGIAAITTTMDQFTVAGQAVSVSAQVRSKTTPYSNMSNAINVNISENSLLAFTDTSTTDKPINTSIPVNIKVNSDGTAGAKVITLNSTLGTITPSQVTVSSFPATANFTLSSTSPGTATLTATTTSAGKTVSIIKDVSVISTIPASFSLNTVTSVLNPSESTKISVIAKDKNSAPTKGVTVNFSRPQDASSGSLSSTSAITDASGTASVFYTAGASATPAGGVIITASLPSHTTISSKSIGLTVTSKAVQIELGWADKISSVSNEVYYEQGYSVRLLDNTGKPIANNEVSLRTESANYLKGQFGISYVTLLDLTRVGIWEQNISAVCSPEDGSTPAYPERNNFLDDGEDINQNGRLDAANPVAIILDNGSVSNGVVKAITNEYGQADFNIRYLKSVANWVTFNLYATANVQGTEGKTARTNGILPVLVDDVSSASDATPIRPNRVSPYGTASSCSNPN